MGITTINLLQSCTEIGSDADRAIFASVQRADLDQHIAGLRERGALYRIVTRTVSALGISFRVHILVVRLS